MKLMDESGIISNELQAIIENTNDLIFVKNMEFVYIASSENYAINCVRCNGPEDVIGKTDFDLFEDKTIAAKYRADDEELLASGKPMIEFEEEYPHRDGTKHTCLTTKYVLHDEEGSPLAIFGLYHDIGRISEKEISLRRDINRNIAEAFNSMFFASNYVDLNTHKYIIIRSTDYSKKMLEGCDTIEKAFDSFISTLVKPEFQGKMRKFCEVDSIAERVKGNAQIDCEYLSRIASGWCRASFMPTEWDKYGNVTHVLFSVCSIDDDKADELDESITNRETIQEIFDESPGGIVLYEWNGEKLKVLQISRYYKELYGYSMMNDDGSSDFARVHPDDIENYKKAFMYAINNTHELEYVYRVWNRDINRYVWTQINAVSKPKPDGTSLIYAIYTDVTAQKEAELEVARKQASLETALTAANQLCCEYDPALHRIKCLTETNFFNIPTQLNDYPECLKNYEIIYPDDFQLYINTVHSTDDGNHRAHCDVRAKRDGRYRWFSSYFEPFFDEEKGRTVIIVTIIDATIRITSVKAYEKRMRGLENSSKDALCMCDVNLTKNQYSNAQANSIIKKYTEKAETLNELMSLTSQAVFDPEEQRKYRELFQQENLLKRFEQGETHISMEHFYRIDEENTAIVATVFDLVQDPVTGDVVGISYAKDLNSTKLSAILLNAALEKDYPLAALLYADTGEYYLYEVNRREFCRHKKNYWKDVYDRLASTVSGQKLERIRSNLTRENVTAHLESNEEFSYSFYGFYNGEKCRLEAKFRYVDRKHNLMLASLRNITDEVLYKQYKYDSEHDSLTGLYNRNTFFKKCREFLNTYPEEQFVILHLDIRHFHLYNTFFGEEKGNELLCNISDALKRMGNEYDYIANGRIQADVFCVFFPVNRGLFEGHIYQSFKELDAFSPNFPLDFAIGAYWVTDPAMSIEAMFSRATLAAKSHRRNLFGLVSRYDESMENELNNTQLITSEMTAAIEHEQFEVYLQPKYSLRSNKIVGAEALVRWKHPQLGMISPGTFIPVFEQNGFIASLDRYMWEHVCMIIRGWHDENKPMCPVSVNISRVSMYSHLTVPFLKSLIEKYEIEPKYLELELTETAYMDDPEELKRMLQDLQQYGFKILMDDFGSGYSSLNTLRDLPVNILKLDMKFITEAEQGSRGRAVLSSVVRMSKLLDLPIVAEGVEKQEQADYLRSIGCEYVQGFLYARPMPAPDYEKMLESESCSTETGQIRMNVQEETDIEEISVPLGVLEFDNEHFAYLRTNQQFIREFDLIENLQPASKVFRDHMDTENYSLLLQAFAICAETGEDSFCSLKWTADDGSVRRYHGYVHYNGYIGSYDDLTVKFINVTKVNVVALQ